jgi:hypothetical protein
MKHANRGTALTEGRFFCYILPMIVVTKEPSLCYNGFEAEPVPGGDVRGGRSYDDADDQMYL